MADKKKAPAKTTERRTPSSPAAKPAKTAGAAAPLTAEQQMTLFQTAIRHFHTRAYEQARALFQEAGSGPQRDVAQRARLHVSMCEQRLQQVGPVLHTAEDHYTYGVAQINARNLASAQEHLARALAMAPGAEHIHYALALSQALAGDTRGAYENLRRAIELEPRNRIAARQDPEFSVLANHPPLDELVYPEKKGW